MWVAGTYMDFLSLDTLVWVCHHPTTEFPSNQSELICSGVIRTKLKLEAQKHWDIQCWKIHIPQTFIALTPVH